jgi:hypothetical protein
MDAICRDCRHLRTEKEYLSSGGKRVHVEPGEWCAGVFSAVAGRKELIPCDVSRASYGGCRSGGDLYEPRLANATNSPIEPSNLKDTEAGSESCAMSAPNKTNEPIMQMATSGVSESHLTNATKGLSDPSTASVPDFQRDLFG